jgi:type I restriction enzyme M protein
MPDMAQTTDEFARRLRAARTAMDLTQEDVARKLGVGLRVYARWESGQGSPHAATLVRLASTLDTTVEELYPVAPQAA